jgi:5-methylcytosine-specific restriction protein A
MKFGPLQLAWFGAEDGASSVVTETEARDPQITLDQYEKEVVAPVYSDSSIFRGSRSSGGNAALHIFYDHFSGTPLSIPFVYPKQRGNELRLYNSGQSGFTPRAGDVWFIYRKKGQLFVGSMLESEWRTLGTTDPDDGDYQLAIQRGVESPVVIQVPNRSATLVKSYPRNPAVARAAISRAEYCCEYKPRTSLFLSRFSKQCYVEAHHLVPLSATENIGCDLDVEDNIVALAPHWHRAIHHATPDLASAIINTLGHKRRQFLSSLGIGTKDLLEIYGCVEITR